MFNTTKTLKIMISPLFYNELCKFYSTPDFIEPIKDTIFLIYVLKYRYGR